MKIFLDSKCLLKRKAGDFAIPSQGIAYILKIVEGATYEDFLSRCFFAKY